MEIVHLLLSKGADFYLVNEVCLNHLHLNKVTSDNFRNVCLKDGNTPLYAAAEAGHIKLVELFLSKGMDIYQTNFVRDLLLQSG